MSEPLLLHQRMLSGRLLLLGLLRLLRLKLLLHHLCLDRVHSVRLSLHLGRLGLSLLLSKVDQLLLGHLLRLWLARAPGKLAGLLLKGLRDEAAGHTELLLPYALQTTHSLGLVTHQARRFACSHPHISQHSLGLDCPCPR